MATDQGPRGRVAIPAEFDDIVTWAAWLYYEEGLNQNDIAQTIGVSRASVVNYLQEARERGVVRISMDPGIMARQSLARGLAARYGLDEVLVVPTAPGSAPNQRLAALGTAGARQIERMLTPGETLCVSWGKTVLAVADAISQKVEGVTVAQVTGAAPGNREFSAELCTAILARNLGAVSKVMHAPAVLSDAALRAALQREPVISEQFALIRAARTILFGIGGMGADSTMRVADIASAEEINAYAEAGAEAVLICRFLDAAGQQIRGDFDQRMMGIGLEDLKAIPRRICVAGGLDKLEALRAALQGGYISHLVTDAETASALAGH